MEAFQSEWIHACRTRHVQGKANHFKLTRSGETPSVSQPIELQAARDSCFHPGHVEALADLLSSKAKSPSWNSRIHNVRTLSLNYGALLSDSLPRCVPALTVLFTCSSITEVELFHTGLTDASASAVASVLYSQDCRITRLKLGENHIGDMGAQALGAALRFNASLQQLNLAGNQLTDNGVRHLADGLAQNSSITGLCLRNNPFGAAGVQALANALRAPNSAVIELQLKGANVGVDGAKALADVLLYNPARGGAPLATLELEETQIGPQGACLLAAKVAANTTLTKLNMNGNRVGDAGAVAFGNALAQNRTLTALGMRANGMTGKGAESLALGLRNNDVMTGLDVGDNALGRAGAAALARLLEGRSRDACGLQCINLGGNQIDGEGIRALASSLSTNKTLTHLDVSFNACSDYDVHELATVLANNSSLTRLCLAGSRFGASGYRALLRAMEGNTSLRSLTLNARGGTPFDPAVFPLRQSLVDRVEENKVLWKEQQQHQPQPPSPTVVNLQLPTQTVHAPIAAAAPVVPICAPPAPIPEPVQQRRVVPLPTPPVSSPRSVCLPEVDPRGLNVRAAPFRPVLPNAMPTIPVQQLQRMQHIQQMQQQMGGSMMNPQTLMAAALGNININTINLNIHPTTVLNQQFRAMGGMGPVPNGVPVMATMAASVLQQQLIQQQQQNAALAPLHRFATACQPQSPKKVQGGHAGNESNSPVKSPILFPHDLWSHETGEEFSGGLGVCGSTASLDLQGVVDSVLENALVSGSIFCIEEEGQHPTHQQYSPQQQQVSVNGGHA